MFLSTTQDMKAQLLLVKISLISGYLLIVAAAAAAEPRQAYGYQINPLGSESSLGSSELVSGQCPLLDKDSTLINQASAHDLVKVDPVSGRRSFEARIVGIFSCLDSDQTGNDLTLDFRLAKPVIDLAVNAVNSMYSHMHFNVTYRTAPDICKHQQAAGHAADEYYVNGANYFVGPGCSESLASVGQLASYWNVPMCSTGYLPEVMTARFNPQTLMQLSLSVQSVGEMLLELFQMYKWRHLVIVTDEKHPLHTLIRDGLLEFFHTMYMMSTGGTIAVPSPNYSLSGAASSSAPGSSGGAGSGPGMPNQSGASGGGGGGGRGRLPYYINITSRNFAYSKTKPVDYEKIMLDAAAYSRIMLLLARSSTIGHLLEAAHAQGMSKGQFVFIAHELFESQMFEPPSGGGGSQSVLPPFVASQQPPTVASGASNKTKFALDGKIEIQASGGGGNGTNEQLTREIYQPLMTISLRIPTTPEFDAFRTNVAGLSEREFNYRIQPTSLKSLYSLGLAAFIYDCVMLYADKVNLILTGTQFSRIDGKTIFELSAGETFTKALTGNLTINKAGQRVIDFTLNDFSPKSLTLEPIAHFMAIERRLNFLPGKQPHWSARGQPNPRSDPRCRINDLFCRYSDDNDDNLANGNYGGLAGTDRVVLGVWLLVAVVFSVALTSSIIGWLVYRRFRIESELLNLWWSIKYEDILFEDETDVMCDGKRSISSLAISNESFNERSQVIAGSNAPASPAATAVATTSNGGNHLTTSGLSSTSVSGRASPQVTATLVGDGSPKSGSPQQGSSVANDSSAKQQQLSQSAMLLTGGGGAQENHAQSGSSLSVAGAPASLSGSTSALARVATPGGSSLPASAVAPGPLSSAAAAAAGSSSLARSPAAGACKLLPLIGKSSASKSVGGTGGSGKFSGSSGQLGGAKSAAGKVQQAGKEWASLGAGGGGGGGGANNKDPSITSQNKNVKLRLGTVLNGGRDHSQTTKVGMYKASRVAVKHLNIRSLNINRQLLIELRQVRDLTHENLIKFIGLCPEEPNIAIVSELCTRGNLQDLLQNETIRLDWPFRYSIINDIVDGLIHLHSSPIQYHGRLKSSNCVIDNRFVVKLTDFGLPTLLASIEMEETEVYPRLLLWTAPEHLRTKHPLLSGSQKGDIYSLAIIFQEIITRCGPFECEPILCGASEVGAPIEWTQPQQTALMAPLIRTTDTSDPPLGQRGRRGAQVPGTRQQQQQRGQHNQHHHQQQVLAPLHSLAASAANRQGPFLQPIVVQHKQRLEPEEIVNLVRMGLSPPFRPYFRPDVATTATGDFNVADLISMVQNCWQEAPALRPTVTNVKQQIKKMRRGCHLDGANLMDNLLQRMERYTDNLESLVEQKTAELMEEKKRSEELLYEMLPRFVVDQLKYGHSVTPEAYEAVTISFSDIKDFTSIAAQSSPIEVVNLLNQLYTEFDNCIAQYDVYKVETIGDAYMVVSGLPIRNGDQHAREIAEMSLALLELIRNFDVAHLPHVNLELRIGIHSGPCASGVVGTRMFRYCLFGDTVNTASRMESHGEPMKIHISEDSANILSRFGTFDIEPRGTIEIKGKGLMNTYWLTGKSH